MQTTRKETETIECTDDDDERIDRLVIEAGKYLGKITGESIDRSEVIEQAKANGYGHQEAQSLLEAKDQTIEIPQQGGLFGELWPDNSSTSLITRAERTVNRFKQWLEEKEQKNETEYDGEKHPFNPEHSWSRKKADKRYVRALDADRYFHHEYEKFSTIHIVRTADDNTDQLHKQTRALTPDRYYQCRLRLMKRLSEEYAALEVKAPRYPENSEKRIRSHTHVGIWLPGHVEEGEFDLLEEKHKAVVEGATDTWIEVRQHSSPYNHVQKNGLDEERGGTTGLPREIASRNHPPIRAQVDVRDLDDDRVIRWCALLSAGSDGSHDTQGVRCWQTLGNFKSYAKEIHDRRESST